MPAPPVSTQTACPLCGEPNACVPTACGDFSKPCWCEDARFAPQLFARARATRGELACICERCARAAAQDPPCP